jgi:hypothetical protein
MAIPEDQLDTWAKQGSVTQSAQTYNTIKSVLDDANAPYHSRNYSVFLQGSYGNDTNVYRESDVDIVIRLNQTYYADTDRLSVGAQANYDRAFVRAEVSWSDFRAEVFAWLQKQYGSDAQSGKKAIFVKGNGNRRNADVIVCCNFRRYRDGSTGIDDQYDEGICFWSDGVQIENFPKQHSANLTSMHQGTSSWLKPVIRLYKNMRNRMIDDQVLKEGIMPSYFIEGMLYNAPNEKFAGSYDSSFVNTYNWITGADESKLVTASGLHWLVREGTHTSLPSAKFNEYLNAVRTYWQHWK